jgi:hypothetical protein
MELWILGEDEICMDQLGLGRGIIKILQVGCGWLEL